MSIDTFKPPGGGIDFCSDDAEQDRSQDELDLGQPIQQQLNLEGGDLASRSAAA